MKNITVAVPDAVYRAARIRAAEQGRSISALVADFLRGLAENDADFRRLEALEGRIRDEITAFSASDRLERDRIHDRAVR
jgi:plasmid stability protein